MSLTKGSWVLPFFVTITGCAPALVVDARVAPRTLAADDGASYTVPSREGKTRLTVLVFSAWHCPCQKVHEARLQDLYSRYRSRGVDFFAVDSESGGSADDDAATAKERGYLFPVLLDGGAGLARALRAEYATESFVIDPRGVVRYHGALDSDRTKIHDDAVPLLANALDDLLAGRPPRLAETLALGCSLRTW